MPDTMRILSRDAFAEVLAETRADTDRLGPASLPQLRVVAAQLAFMAEATHRGRVPSPAERARTSLGPIAVREFETTDPDYADRLEELDYTFQRYPQLPPGPPIRRRAILQVWSGPGAFTKIILDPCTPQRLTTDGAALPGEPAPGQPHVHVVWDGVSTHVQARGAHRLTIAGQPAWYGELTSNSWMTAGTTTLRSFVEDYTPPRAPVVPTPASDAALAALTPHHQAGHLYAVLDAARTMRVLQLLNESVDPHASLYDGEAGRAFDDVAPYLVHLRRDSQLLARLVHEGWGDAWGLWLVSRADFTAVRRHLRQFLRVEAAGHARPLYFRFYDPRVFTPFAEVVSPEQRAALLHNVDAILHEEKDQLRRFDPLAD